MNDRCGHTNDPGDLQTAATPALDYAEAGYAARDRVPLLALLTCWLRPATHAPRLTGVKLRWAYLVHILAGLAFFFGVLLFVQIDAWMRGSHYNVFADLVRELEGDWEEATLITGFSVLGIEIGFLALALIVLPWGAADERLRSSWAHALRFTWLHTTHALVLLVVIGSAALVIDNARRSYYRRHPQSPPDYGVAYPQQPPRPSNAAPNSQAWKDYVAAQAQYMQKMQEYHRDWRRNYQKWRRTQPFIVQHHEDMLAWLCIAGSVWVLWALFRSVGARRTLTRVERPPTCEFCGYNLTGTAIEGRCPECGTPAFESLGPQVRPGTSWERGGGLIAWTRCHAAAVFRPRMLGHQIQVTTQPHRHRWLWWSLILPCFLAGAATTLISYMIIEQCNPMEQEPEIVTIVMPIIGACSGAGMLMIAMLLAGAIGMIQTWLHKRNLLPAAAQMAAYLSPLFLLCGLFLAAWSVVFVVGVEERWFRHLASRWRMDDDLLAFGFFVVPQLAWLALCFVLIWKGTSAARYANR